MHRRHRAVGTLDVAVGAVASAAAGCTSRAASGEPEESHPPPMSVELLVMEPRLVRDTSDYLAVLSSRSSVALYPQVVGHVGKIFVKPGERVKAGASLVEIDPTQPRAILEQLSATRTLKEAALRNAEQRAKRASSLFGEGLVSQQDFDQAKSERDIAAADMSAAEAQMHAQASQLRYFTIAAPFDGTVGDVPVKLGDLVTAITKVTTIDQNAMLEAYVNVPVERAKELGPESRVELLDDRGEMASESPVTFVADQAAADTQSVLIKALFANTTSLRAAQSVRARVVWRTRPGLRLPTTAVVRQSGQTFAFVAEGETGATVAKQRAVTLGAIDGSEYVVVSGLKAGDRVILSSVQKLHEGAPVAAASRSAAPAAGPPASSAVKN